MQPNIDRSQQPGFFALYNTPMNWGINKAAERHKDGEWFKSRFAVIGMVELSALSAVKNLVCFVVKVPFALFALTLGLIPPISRRCWTPLENAHLIEATAGQTLLMLVNHVYHTVMFLTISPLSTLIVGFIYPTANKSIHVALKLVVSNEPKEVPPPAPQACPDPKPDPKPEPAPAAAVDSVPPPPPPPPLPPAVDLVPPPPLPEIHSEPSHPLAPQDQPEEIEEDQAVSNPQNNLANHHMIEINKGHGVGVLAKGEVAPNESPILDEEWDD